MAYTNTFKTGYFFRLIRKDYNPLTPDILEIDDQVIHHKRRNWYLLSTNYQKYHFENIIGIDVRQELFGADIVIETTGRGTVQVRGFSKREARQISGLCSEYMIKNAPRNIIDSLNENLNKLADTKDHTYSKADEISKLKDLQNKGILTGEEFEAQKQRILNL